MAIQIKKHITINLYWLSTWLVFIWGLNYLALLFNHLRTSVASFSDIPADILLIFGIAFVITSFGLRKKRIWALYVYTAFETYLLVGFLITGISGGLRAITSTSVDSLLSVVLLLYYWYTYRFQGNSKTSKQQGPAATFNVGLNFSKRPITITIIAILGFVISSIGLVFHLIPGYWVYQTHMYPVWYVIFETLLDAANTLGFVLLWKMKRVSLYILAGTFIIQPFAAYFFLHSPFPNDLASYLLIILVTAPLVYAITQYKKMR